MFLGVFFFFYTQICNEVERIFHYLLYTEYYSYRTDGVKTPRVVNKVTIDNPPVCMFLLPSGTTTAVVTAVLESALLSPQPG